MLEAIRALYGYNHWATERLLDMAVRLTPEQWLTPGNAGRGSARDTLVHLIAAQRRWLAWWDGSVLPHQAQHLALELAPSPGKEVGVWEASMSPRHRNVRRHHNGGAL